MGKSSNAATKRLGTFAKNQKKIQDDGSSINEGSGEGEISNSLNDLEEPEDEAVRDVESRHNTGISIVGSQIPIIPKRVGSLV